MNSLDDFAQLRPETNAATDPELESMWAMATGATTTSDGVGSAPGSLDDRSDDQRCGVDPVSLRVQSIGRRKLALLGAAASILIGVGGIAAVSDRDAAPSALGTSEEPDTTRASPDGQSESTMSPLTPTEELGSEALGEVGNAPLWGVRADGWTMVEFEDDPGPADAAVRVFAGPGGIAESWVVIVEGMSEPIVGGVPSFGGSGSIRSQRMTTEHGRALVTAGGVSDSQATAVFRSISVGEALPEGFVEADNAANAMVRTLRYRFENDSGEHIAIEVHGAGEPQYQSEIAHATAVEAWESTEGVDESDVAFAGEYTLLLRNEFWVSRVVTSAPFDAPATFERLARLVEIVPEDEWAASLPFGPSRLGRVVVGDMVTLGAADELARAGFVVDADESRAFVGGLDIVRSLADEDRLPNTLVVALGTNGTIGESQIAEMLGLVADVEQVVFVTNRVDRDYAGANNALLRSLAEIYENVEILDWEVLGDDCTGDCFEADGVHLKPDGRQHYTELLVEATR